MDTFTVIDAVSGKPTTVRMLAGVAERLAVLYGPRGRPPPIGEPTHVVRTSSQCMKRNHSACGGTMYGYGHQLLACLCPCHPAP